MTVKTYETFLKQLERAGFAVCRDSYHIFQRSAEIYQCGQWTVQIGTVDASCDEAETLYVETYFDSEMLDYRAKYQTFPADQSKAAMDYALSQARSLRGDLLSESCISI